MYISERERERERDRERETEREREGEALVICDFWYCHKSHFPENVIKISLAVQKIWRVSSSLLWFASIFWTFLDFLVTKKLMKSGYKKWYPHF